MLCILMLYRHCLKRREYAYTRVYRYLDPEEQEFKRNPENQTDEIDDLFDFGANGGDADDEFDAKDLKQLEMLDTYRATSSAAMAFSRATTRTTSPLAGDEVLTPFRINSLPALSLSRLSHSRPLGDAGSRRLASPFARLDAHLSAQMI